MSRLNQGHVGNYSYNNIFSLLSMPTTHVEHKIPGYRQYDPW